MSWRARDDFGGRDRLGFRLGAAEWREAFAQPAGWSGRCFISYYAAMRLAIFSVWLGCVVWSIAYQVEQNGAVGLAYWWIKLTHWSGFTELVYFGFAAYTTIRARMKTDIGGCVDEDSEAAPWFASVTWCLSAIVPTISTLVFALFWLLDHVPGKVPPPVSFAMHGGNIALVLVDLVCTRQPYCIEHVYAPMLFGATYLSFTVLYYMAGGTSDNGRDHYIYAVLDWSKPHNCAKLVVVIVLIVLPCVYTLLSCVVRCRVSCSKDLARGSETSAANGNNEAPTIALTTLSQ